LPQAWLPAVFNAAVTCELHRRDGEFRIPSRQPDERPNK
jgi:hypothetical protein